MTAPELIELVGGPHDGMRYIVRHGDSSPPSFSGPSEWPTTAHTETHRYRKRVDENGDPVIVDGHVLYDHTGTRRA